MMPKRQKETKQMIQLRCDAVDCESVEPFETAAAYGGHLPDGWCAVTGSVVEESPMAAAAQSMASALDNPELPAHMLAIGDVFKSSLAGLTKVEPFYRQVTYHYCGKHSLPPTRKR